jgi:hypothetical protein
MPGTSRVADRVTRDIARWAVERQVVPLAMAAFSLGFAIIAAAWYTAPPARAQVTGLVFLIASMGAARVASVMAGQLGSVATQWGRAACVLLGELAIYAGLAGQASRLAGTTDGFTGMLASQLRGGITGNLGGHGAAGAWLLAVAAAIVLSLLHLTDLCAAGPSASLPRLGSTRLLLTGVALLLGGPRAAIEMALVLGTLSLLYVLVRQGAAATGGSPVVAGYRGDGPLAAWIGGFVEGKLPPMPPAGEVLIAPKRGSNSLATSCARRPAALVRSSSPLREAAIRCPAATWDDAALSSSPLRGAAIR